MGASWSTLYFNGRCFSCCILETCTINICFFVNVGCLFQLTCLQAVGGHRFLLCKRDRGFITAGNFFNCYVYLTNSSVISGILTCIPSHSCLHAVSDTMVQAVPSDSFSGWACVLKILCWFFKFRIGKWIISKDYCGQLFFFFFLCSSLSKVCCYRIFIKILVL